MPVGLRRALTKLGGDMNVARRKRGMTIDEVAAAAAVSPQTVGRVERGDPTVSIGVLAMVLLALGEHRRIGDILDPSRDDAGLALDEARLPKRVRRRPNVPLVL